ncbi:beta-propeller domain-containing protein, partial [Candidatus Peregrinibacteria bacterium]|nr:beta-propeller domain-containing protein [Candidatus Peregrinibacteria bacterium]
MKKMFTYALSVIGILLLANAASADTFIDIPSTQTNRDAIEYLKTKNVIQGYEDSTFKPDNRINRAEFVKIVVASQVANPTGSDCFTDVGKEWFAKYVCHAKRLGYIKGYDDGSFKPGEFINFAEASKIVSNALGVKADATGTNQEWFAGFTNGLAKKNAIPSTVQFFDKDLSRGEMAEMIWRLKANKTDKVSQTYEGLTSPFPSVGSCVGLKEKFDEFQSRQSYPYYRGGIMMDVMSAPTASPQAKMAEPPMGAGMAAESASNAGAADYSQTNIQVAGVDEADIIKNDGKYIYMVKTDSVRIFEAFPAKNMQQVSVVRFGSTGFTPQEMFVDGNRLVVVGQVYQNYYYPMPLLEGIGKMIMPPRPFQGPKTKVYQFDITDRKNPKQIRALTFDGNYNTSRRIGEKMVLVLNDYPNYWMMDKVENGDQLLPSFQDGDKAEEPMAKCADIHYFPGYAQPNYLIVASIPLGSASADVEREVMLGSSDNVYSSVDNLYVATSQVNYANVTDWDWRRDHTDTQIFRFSIEGGNVAFRGRGAVPGRILNQFSMDESGSTFRIATTIDSWDSEKPSGNNVYVLDRANMEVKGKIEEIAPGEKIYSTRFMGDRLYMVTFQRVDPLFVIGLEDPANPKILGKLKIPGFSDYLHPYDKTHIIGFGKETEETKEGNVRLQGFKMALFDVSDVANPVQQFSENIGDMGTSSDLLYNHKALLF